MKLAVITDIHSNHFALEAALELIDKEIPDAIIFLGDYISDCPCPEKTMALIYQTRDRYPCFFVRGNREDYMLAHRRGANDGWEHNTSSGSLLYTYEHLTEKDLDFFAKMPIYADIALPGAPIITACHGSPARTKEWILDRHELLEKYMSQMRGEVLLCGHTHHAQHVHKTVLKDGGPVKRTAIFCPSVGLPQDGKSHARLTLLTLYGDRFVPRMLPLSYDREALFREFHESGLVESTGVWARCIMQGIIDERDYALECVTLAWKMALADRYTGHTTLPEKYWETAAKAIGIPSKIQ